MRLAIQVYFETWVLPEELETFTMLAIANKEFMQLNSMFNGAGSHSPMITNQAENDGPFSDVRLG